MIVAPVSEAGPARALAVYGAAVELLASRRVESRLGVVDEVFHTGTAGRQLRLAKQLTAAGAVGAVLLARRSKVAAVVCGSALLAGGLAERLGLLNAGRQSTVDPRYVVEPQRERLAARRDERQPGSP
jgi:hypothetical protein